MKKAQLLALRLPKTGKKDRGEASSTIYSKERYIIGENGLVPLYLNLIIPSSRASLVRRDLLETKLTVSGA